MANQYNPFNRLIEIDDIPTAPVGASKPASQPASSSEREPPRILVTTNEDRTAVQWLALIIDAQGGTLRLPESALIDVGRLSLRQYQDIETREIVFQTKRGNRG